MQTTKPLMEACRNSHQFVFEVSEWFWLLAMQSMVERVSKHVRTLKLQCKRHQHSNWLVEKIESFSRNLQSWDWETARKSCTCLFTNIQVLPWHSCRLRPLSPQPTWTCWNFWNDMKNNYIFEISRHSDVINTSYLASPIFLLDHIPKDLNASDVFWYLNKRKTYRNWWLDCTLVVHSSWRWNCYTCTEKLK